MPEETNLKKQPKTNPVDFKELDETVVRFVTDEGENTSGAATGGEAILPIDGIGKALINTTLQGGILIKSMIGSGGMSSVYRGFQQTLDREVAVKVMHSHLLSEDNALKRFNQEAHAAARLDHPNIVKVHDFRADDSGKSFLVMDLVEGVALSDAIDQNGWLESERAINIFTQACDALQHAHTKGVVHRDLKPSNIMLVKNDTGDDTVKILDFGIAKILPQQGDKRTKLTQTGEVFGSPLYMSPEQCMGKDIDLRSDIYSMGCLIFESLTGHPPLEGANAFDTFFKHTTEKPPSLKEFRNNLDNWREFDAVILKAMAKDPKERYQSMAELKADLQRLGKNDKNWIGKVSDDVELMRRGMSARKKISTPLAVLGGGLCLATIAAVGLFYQLSQQPKIEAGSAAWNQLFQTAQNEFDKGKYDDAKKDFELALKTAGEDKILAVPVLRELTDLDHALGNPKNGAYEQQFDQRESERQAEVRSRLSTLLSKFKETAKNTGPEANAELQQITHEINDQSNLIHKGSVESRKLSQNALKTTIDTFEARGDTNNDAYTRSTHNFGCGLLIARKYKEALQSLEKAVAVRKLMAEADPSNLRNYLHSLQWFANAYALNGDKVNAEKMLQMRLEKSRKVATKGAATFYNSSIVAESKFLLAEFNVFEKEDLKVAREYANAAIEAYESLEVPERREQADCYTLLGVINMQESNFKEAERNFEQGRNIYESLLQKETGYWVEDLLGLGDVHLARKDYAGAEPYFRRALSVAERSDLRHDNYVDILFSRLQQTLNKRGAGPEQLKHLLALGNQRLQFDQAKMGANSEFAVRDYNNLADTARRMNDLKQTEAYLNQALEANSKLEKPDNALHLQTLIAKGRLELDKHEGSAGAKTFEDAVALAEQLKGEKAVAKQTLLSLQYEINTRLKDSADLNARADRLVK